jgi:hypothetical protein
MTIGYWKARPYAHGSLFNAWQIPTLIAYRNGEASAYGVKARDLIGDEEYEVARWFKVGD